MASIDLFRNDPSVAAFSAGDVLIEDGSTNLAVMLVVVEGEVDIIAHGKTVDTIGPGGIIGEMALIDHHPRSAGAIAKTAGKFATVDDKRFEFLVRNTPFFALEVMQVMANRLRHMNEIV